MSPWRWLKILVRRWTLREDVRNPTTPADLPPALQSLAVGEILPWKGTHWRVGKIIGGDFPCVVIVPTGRTRGAKLKVMREFRDAARDYRDEQRAIASALRKATH